MYVCFMWDFRLGVFVGTGFMVVDGVFVIWLFVLFCFGLVWRFWFGLIAELLFN